LGKRISDLHLGDDGPEGQPSGPGEVQADSAVRELKRLSVAAFRTVNQIDVMLLDPDFQFARDTLESISKQVQAKDAVSDGQLQAIENIRDGGLRHGNAHRGWNRHENRTGRRYR